MAFKIKDYTKAVPLDEDHLASRMDRFWLFAEQNRTAILGGLLLIIAASAAIAGLLWYNSVQEERAWALHQQAVELYIDRPADDPQKAQEHLEQAVTLFQKILQEYPQTGSAELSYYFIGNAKTEQKQYEEAIQAYEAYATKYGKNPMLLGLVYQRLGYCYLLMGNQSKAEEVFAKVLAMPETLNQDQVLFELGKLAENGGNKDTALAYYKRLIAEHADSPLAGETNIRIRALEPPPADQKSETTRSPDKSPAEAAKTE